MSGFEHRIQLLLVLNTLFQFFFIYSWLFTEFVRVNIHSMVISGTWLLFHFFSFKPERPPLVHRTVV